MVVRLTFIRIAPENEDKLKNIFTSEIIPTVKKQKGNVDIKLLHPKDEKDEHVSMTTWENKEDADAYQASGTYQKLVDMLKDYFLNPPVLKSFVTEG